MQNQLSRSVSQRRQAEEKFKQAALNKKSVIHVLHVDDDPSILEISRHILMDMGSFDIDNACCVDEAFKKLAIAKYYVVVSDYEMPQKADSNS